jgi:hypothetical protein
MTQADARSRVMKGAVHLDQVRPGWAWEIDPGTLDLADECLCVFGQVFGHYWDGVKHLPTLAGWPLGFDVSSKDYNTRVDMDVAYRMLQDAWIEAICDRLLPIAAEGQPAQVEVSK